MAPTNGLRVTVAHFDLNPGVDFKDVRLHFHVNVLSRATRPLVEARIGDLLPATAGSVTATVTVPLDDEQVATILENATTAAGEPSLVVVMQHVTHNQVGERAVTEQGTAVVPLARGVGTRTTVAFHTTYEMYNRASTSIRTAGGVAASASVACAVTLLLDTPRALASALPGGGRVGAPRVCDNQAVPLNTAYLARLAEYRAAVGGRLPLRANLNHINFAQFLTAGCELPGWAFCQNVEKQVVEDAVIEQATVFACLVLAPRPISSAAEQLSVVRDCLATPFVRARPTAVFQTALQLPAVSLVYMQDTAMVPSDFASQELVTVIDGHRYGQTDSYRKAEYTATDDIENAAGADDCEDDTNLTSDDMGLCAQDYVLRHADDPATSLSYWVARALAPVLEYVPGFAHNSLSDSDNNSHMAAVFKHRSGFPHDFQTPPWGRAPASLPLPLANPPPALYMDSVYFTPDVPANRAAMPIVRAVSDSITDESDAVESHIKVTDLPWLDEKSPANDFVVGRFFTDVRCFQPRGRAWLEPATGERVPSRIVPMWVPTDTRKPGTYGVRLRDMCLGGAEVCEMVPCTVPLKKWNETMAKLAWCHPPVPITLRVDRTVRCTKLRDSGGPNEGKGKERPRVLLPLVIRRSSYTPARVAKVVRAAQAAAPGVPCDLWQIEGPLCSISGYIDILVVQY